MWRSFHLLSSFVCSVVAAKLVFELHRDLVLCAGALKIKISRKPKQSPESLHADSSETEDTDQVAVRDCFILFL